MQATDYKLLSDKSKSRQRFVAFNFSDNINLRDIMI